jgi:hypothetical protein
MQDEYIGEKLSRKKRRLPWSQITSSSPPTLYSSFPVPQTVPGPVPRRGVWFCCLCLSLCRLNVLHVGMINPYPQCVLRYSLLQPPEVHGGHGGQLCRLAHSKPLNPYSCCNVAAFVGEGFTICQESIVLSITCE